MSYYIFYLRDSYINKDGKSPILIRYYEARNKRVQIKTGINISKRYWSNSKNFIKKSSEILNDVNELNNCKLLADNIINHYAESNQTLTKGLFEKHYKNKNIFSKKEIATDFYSELELFIEEKKKSVVKDVIKDYNSLKKQLKAYDDFYNNLTSFESIDYTFYKNWTNYLAYDAIKKNGEVGFKNNTIGKLVKNLKAFLNDRIRHKRIDPIDLSGFKVLQEEVDHIYLNSEEITAMYNVDCKNDVMMQKAKDFFVLGCLIGLRFSDTSRIKPEYIQNDFIQLKQKKTSNKVIIPLRKLALKILSDYNNFCPDINSYELNKKLKALGKKARINTPIELEHKRGNIKERKLYKKHELISSHTCRRSFCTNAYLDGIDSHLIMQISGHKTEKDFKRYLKLSNYEAALKMKEAWGI